MDKTLVLENEISLIFPKEEFYSKKNNIMKIIERKNSFVSKVIFKLCFKFNLFWKRYLAEWSKDIERIRNLDKVIIFTTPFDNRLIQYIRSINKTCEIHIFVWNLIKPSDKIKQKKKLDTKIWTFDKSDSEKYSIGYNMQFYFPRSIKHLHIARDVLFVGAGKNRVTEILKIKQEVDANSLTSLFHVVKTKKYNYTQKEEKFLVKNDITYQEYLNYVFSSKAIIDICIQGQVGLTLRPLEALFYKKKLITNNTDIINYNFYKTQNIYILGEEKRSLQDFLEEGIVDIDNSIKSEYTFEMWIKRFQ